MAIKVKGTPVIDNSRNFVNVESVGFADGTAQSSADFLELDFRNTTLTTVLDNPNAYSTSADDLFGSAVAVSGNYAIVGAYEEDDAGGTGSGKVYIYNVTTGALVHTLDNPNAYSTSASDYFGNSVAISGNYAIVAAYAEGDAGGNTSGKAYIFNVTTGALVHTLDNPNAYSTSNIDRFGWSVAISDNYAIVGAYFEDDASGLNSGKAYIFNVGTGALVHTLDNPNAYSTSLSDRFGDSVAISGNYAIVGTYLEDDAGGTTSGKAYIFNVTTGALLHTLDNPNAYSTSAVDDFGTSVSISDNYAIVGAYGEDDAGGGAGSGKAYIFNVTTGALLHTLDNPNAYGTSAGDYFGYSVSISGNYAIVGAYLEDDAGGFNSGKAYIFNVTTGSLVHTLDNPNAYGTSSGDLFGHSVAISGNYAIIGAYQEDDAGGIQSGKAYIFAGEELSYIGREVYYDTETEIEYSAGALVHTLDNPNVYSTSLNDLFGWEVAISGNYAIVGAYLEDAAGGSGSGKAYIFNVTTGALLHTLDNPTAYSTSQADYFGYSVAMSGNYAIVGAYNEDDAGGLNSGKAYIFNVTTGALVHTLDNPNAYSTSQTDRFGDSVAISGNYAIVGAYSEADAGGTFSGKAYIYNVTTGALVHTLDNPNAYSTSASDIFGYSVAISGNYAIVGADQEDDTGGNDSGKAYIYNVTNGALVHTLDNPNAYGTSAGDQFSISVSISGNYAIVGARYEDDAGGTSSSKAYIFDVTTGALVHTLDNPNAYSTSAGDSFGDTVAISGNYAIVGANSEDDAGGSGSGKAYIFDVTTGALVHTLDNPNAYSTSAGDSFAWTVAISGNYAIVAAYSEDDAGGTTSSKAYIFTVDDVTKYSQIDKINFSSTSSINPSTDALQSLLEPALFGGALARTLDNPNAYSTSVSDFFGLSVAISDNYAIAGAYQEGDAGGFNSGKVYIYNVTTGALVHTLDNPNAYSTSGNDFFGYSVAISGNYAIVGAHFEDDAGGSDSGKAYIFNVTTGALVHTIDNPNAYSTSANDNFGISVAISDNYAIVGAYREDDAGGLTSGKAYIYNVTTGALVHTLDNPNAYSTSSGDNFGLSVAISGNYAIVGAFDEDDAGDFQSGKAYIYNVTTSALVHTLDNPNAYSASLSDRFGLPVAVSGNYAIVGAIGEDDAGGGDSGKAYIFNVTTGALVHTLDNPTAYSTSSSDNFASTVAMSGNYAIVGAYREDDAGGFNSGKVYIFNVTTGALVHTLDNPTAYSTSASDRFGYSASISGNYAIVGAYFEDDAGGGDSGKAYIFSVTDQTYIDKLLVMVQ